ncbi:MAG: ATP synthase F1 subunit gamma [Gemmataceae bacterium]
MAKTRALVKRRKAIRNIRKITRTMELIATARFKKALDRASEAEAYTQKIAELSANLSASATSIQHPLLEEHEEINNSVLLVLCSNRGLCGGYNTSVLREAGSRIREIQDEAELHLEVSGRRGISYYRYQRVPVETTYTQFEDKPAFEDVNHIAERYIRAYVNKQIDRVEVAYMKFFNAGRQVPVVETLLPLSSVTSEKKETPTERNGNLPFSVEYEFLPSPKEILEEILPVSFKVRLFKCFLDAAVSEQIARRVAMKAATENAGDLIKAISQKYNRVRQGQITTEIMEIIGGAEALK